jgi:hypothetical protein
MRDTAHVTVAAIKVLPNKYRDITRYLFTTTAGRVLLWHSSNGGKHPDGRPFEMGDELTIIFTVRDTNRSDGMTEITRAKALDHYAPLPSAAVDPRQMELF